MSVAVASYSIPAPRTWSAGMQVKAPYLRADAADAIALLSAPPMFSGSQSVAQAIASSTSTAVTLDTEQYDNLGGHLASGATDANYYGMLPGWHLCTASAGVNYTGGAGAVAVAFGLSAGGGAPVTYYGQNTGASATAGQYAVCYGAKLFEMTSTGSRGGASNDYVQLQLNQSSGASQNTLVTASAWPQMQVRWVAASSGTAPLAVPANPAWPTPPSYITSAFMNANVRDAIRFLIYPPICEAYYNAGTATLASQSTIPAVGTAIPMDAKRVDNYGAFSTSTHTFTAPVAGVYWFYTQACLSAAATRVALAAGLTVTSANYNGGTAVTLWGGPSAFGATSEIEVARRTLRLNAGDTVAPAAFQYDSGANAATFYKGTVRESRFIAIWRPA